MTAYANGEPRSRPSLPARRPAALRTLRDGGGPEALRDQPPRLPGEPLVLPHRDHPTHLEAGELDPARGPHGTEAEVGEEVRGKDGPVRHEALLNAARPLRVAVREGLDRVH